MKRIPRTYTLPQETIDDIEFLAHIRKQTYSTIIEEAVAELLKQATANE